MVPISFPGPLASPCAPRAGFLPGWAAQGDPRIPPAALRASHLQGQRLLPPQCRQQGSCLCFGACHGKGCAAVGWAGAGPAAWPDAVTAPRGAQLASLCSRTRILCCTWSQQKKTCPLCKGHSSPPFRLGVELLLGNVHRASWPKGLQLFRVLFSVQKSAKKLLGGVPTKSFLSLGCPARYPHGERPHCWWLCPRSSFPRVLAAAGAGEHSFRALIGSGRPCGWRGQFPPWVSCPDTPCVPGAQQLWLFPSISLLLCPQRCNLQLRAPSLWGRGHGAGLQAQEEDAGAVQDVTAGCRLLISAWWPSRGCQEGNGRENSCFELLPMR